MKSIKTQTVINFLKAVSDDKKILATKYKTKSDHSNLPYCFRLSLLLNGKNINAWGSDKNKDQAALKAIIELYERVQLMSTSFEELAYFKHRYFFKKFSKTDLINSHKNATNWLGTSSNGMATHTSFYKAQKNAISELIERHVILKALAIGIPPKKISYNPSDIAEINDQLSFYQWNGPIGRKIIICRVKTLFNTYLYSHAANIILT